MTLNFTDFVAGGFPAVKLTAYLYSQIGATPEGWIDLPQASNPSAIQSVAIVNSSIYGITIDPDSDWPWVGVAGPHPDFISGSAADSPFDHPLLNQGIATPGSPLLRKVVLGGANIPVDLEDPIYQNKSSLKGNIISLCYNPFRLSSIDFSLNTDVSDFYTYWDNSAASGASTDGLVLRCTVWLTEPVAGMYGTKRDDWLRVLEPSVSSNDTTIIARIPAFGRLGVAAASNNCNSGDVVTVKGVSWGATTNPTKQTLFTITVPASGAWSFDMTDFPHHACEVSLTRVGTGGTISVFTRAWDRT